MAIRSFPFDAESGDRVLDTQQWARLTAALAGDGVVPGLGSEMDVVTTEPETLAVRVSLGDYMIQGRHFQVHSEPETVTLDTADATNPRIDRIVVRRDMSNRTVVVGKVTGTPAVSPTPPSLTQQTDGIWEDPLRRVFVRANATAIRASDQSDGQGYLEFVERRFAPSRLERASWVHITSGSQIGGNSVGIGIANQFPAGTFSAIRGYLRGGLDTIGERINIRINGVTHTDPGGENAYLSTGTVVNPDGSVDDSWNTQIQSGRMAQWTTGDNGTCEFLIEGTNDSDTLPIYATGFRHGSTVRRRTHAGITLIQPTQITSIALLTFGANFAKIRWRIEGYRA